MIVTLLIVIVLVALALYGVELLPVDHRITQLLQLVIIAAAIFYLVGMLR